MRSSKIMILFIDSSRVPKEQLSIGSTSDPWIILSNKRCVYQSEWPSPKSLQTINAGEGVEKREPSYTVGESVNWCSHYGEQCGGSLKN